MGGMVAIRAALKAPERFRSLILMDTAAHGITLFEPKIQAQLNELVTREGCQALLSGMQAQPQSPVVQRGIDFLGAAEHWRRIRVKLEQMDPQAFVDLGRELSTQTSVLDKLHTISMPTTILVGEDDVPFINPSKTMASAIDDAELVKIPNARHSPQYENADIWRDALLSHLDRTKARS